MIGTISRITAYLGMSMFKPISLKTHGTMEPGTAGLGEFSDLAMAARALCRSAIPAALLLTACGGITHRVATGPSVHDTQAIDLGKFDMARIEIKMGAGELNVQGGSPKLLEADFQYNVPEWKPVVDSHPSSFRADVTISQPEGVSAVGDTQNKWNLRLNDAVPMNVVTHLGAGEAQMSLGSMDLENLEIHMGVGKLDLDLRGQPKRDYNVDIKGGVGEATVHLPNDDKTGIVATATGGIGDVSVEGLEKRDGRWVNRAYERAPVRIHIDVKGGVGDIRLIAN